MMFNSIIQYWVQWDFEKLKQNTGDNNNQYSLIKLLI